MPEEETKQKSNTSKNGERHPESCALSFADFKDSLGKTSLQYSDEQIEILRVAFDKIADITFDAWLIRKNTT